MEIPLWGSKSLYFMLPCSWIVLNTLCCQISPLVVSEYKVPKDLVSRECLFLLKLSPSLHFAQTAEWLKPNLPLNLIINTYNIRSELIKLLLILSTSLAVYYNVIINRLVLTQHHHNVNDLKANNSPSKNAIKNYSKQKILLFKQNWRYFVRVRSIIYLVVSEYECQKFWFLFFVRPVFVRLFIKWYICLACSLYNTLPNIFLSTEANAI